MGVGHALSRGRRVAVRALLVAVSACGGYRAAQGPTDASSDDPGGGPVDGSSDGHTGPGDGPSDGPSAAPATLRLIAPLSMASVTQQRPTLRWTLPVGAESVAVDLCKDRACTTPLSIAAPTSSSSTSAMPQAALPRGWVYWRVRATSGADTLTSATWQFWVGAASARNPVDTSNGAVLDVNGDGYADFLVGAPAGGLAYLYFGSATASATDWTGAAPARIALYGLGSSLDFAGSLASAGDINGDGYADFLIGEAGAGTAHLYFGSANPSADGWNQRDTSERVDLANPVAGSAGFGGSVAGLGDVDGDGYGDFAVGNAGVAHVYFGSAAPSASDWGATSTRRIDLANVFSFGSGFGGPVAGAGDVNGDGYADFLVGAEYAENNMSQIIGAAYLYLGSASPIEAEWSGPAPTKRVNLVNPDGTTNSVFGAAVAGAGDVNGDGFSDFVVTNYGIGPARGVAHVYLGAASPNPDEWNVAPHERRVELLNPDGENARFGGSAAGAGDMNGDGFSDFLVGTFSDGFLTSATGGAAHVYLGFSRGVAADWNGSPRKRIDIPNPGARSSSFGNSVAIAGPRPGRGARRPR